MISAAWALALPVNGTYDEKHHIVRAYAVAAGHWLPDGPASDGTTFGSEGFDVPASLLPGNVDCAVGAKRRGPASCQTPVAGGQLVRTPSAAARYSPVYYLPVGLPLLAMPDGTGILIARLVSALMSALLLAAAATTAVRLGNRVLVAAVALVATPMAMNLGGSVNPNGLEISAGVLLFVALSALLNGPVTRRLLVLAGVAAAILLTVRQLGPVLLAVDVAACAVVAGRARLTALARSRSARSILGGCTALGVVLAGAWLAVSGGADAAFVPQRVVHGDLAPHIVTDRVPFYVRQVVGQFGYGETTLSPYAICLWYLLCLAVVVPALVRGGRRLRLTIAGLGVFCLAMLVALDWHFAPLSGWFSHGRYAMPTGVGIVLLAALARPVRRPHWLPAALVVATLPVHLYALARVMTRFSSGMDASLNPFAGGWHPAGGAVTPLLVAVLGFVALAAVGWITQRSAYASPGTVLGEPDNGCVTPIGQSASRDTKASTTDAASL
nr:DUF2142 domain-containing protein [Planosporangium flavigriseum]